MRARAAGVHTRTAGRLDAALVIIASLHCRQAVLTKRQQEQPGEGLMHAVLDLNAGCACILGRVSAHQRVTACEEKRESLRAMCLSATCGRRRQLQTSEP